MSTAEPMPPADRLANYRRQNGCPPGPVSLKPGQRRRYDRKQALWRAEAARWWREIS